MAIPQQSKAYLCLMQYMQEVVVNPEELQAIKASPIKSTPSRDAEDMGLGSTVPNAPVCGYYDASSLPIQDLLDTALLMSLHVEVLRRERITTL